MKLIKIGSQTIVLNKISSVFIPQNDNSNLVIWLDGGFSINNHYDSPSGCKKDLFTIEEALKEL